jgi:hypothetical protein
MTGRQLRVELRALAWLDNKENWQKWEKELPLRTRFMSWLYK